MEQMSKIDVELALQRLEGVTAMLSAFALEDGSPFASLAKLGHKLRLVTDTPQLSTMRYTLP